MNRLIFFILFALYLFSTESYGQLVIDHFAMNRIDIKRYEENKQKKANGGYLYRFEGEDGAIIQLIEVIELQLIFPEYER